MSNKGCNPEFRRRLNRLQKVAIQEIIDGCIECSRLRHLCPDHLKAGEEIILRPKQNMDKIMKPGAGVDI